MTAIDRAVLIEAATKAHLDAYELWDRWAEHADGCGGGCDDEIVLHDIVEDERRCAEAVLPVIARELLAPLRELHKPLDQLLVQTRGGYLMNPEYETRDEWHVLGGRYESVMQHTNPDQTPELYEAELSAWFAERRASRAAG